MECLVCSGVSFLFAHIASWTILAYQKEILQLKIKGLIYIFCSSNHQTEEGCEWEIISYFTVKEAGNGVLDSFSPSTSVAYLSPCWLFLLRL